MLLPFQGVVHLFFQYDSQGVASLALGYGQIALSGRCCGQKAQRAHKPRAGQAARRGYLQFVFEAGVYSIVGYMLQFHKIFWLADSFLASK